MFRFFEQLVDPYVAYPQQDTPPRKLWPFLLTYARPFRGLFVLAGLSSIIVAVIEIGLIAYMGRVVDCWAAIRLRRCGRPMDLS